MLSHALLLLLAASGAPASTDTAGRVEVPARFVEHRIIAQPRSADGEVLDLWVDTGGGGGPNMILLTDAAARRIGLATRQEKVGDESLTLAAPPAFAAGAGLPRSGRAPQTVLVVPAGGLDITGESLDGMLGAGYLAGDAEAPRNIWTFDYPGGHLALEAPDWHAPSHAHRAPLHFKTDANRQRQSGFPRIEARIDGEPLSLLLDTGATALPTPDANAAQGGEPPVRATSFITTAQLERWHRAHPQWRLVEDAERMPIGGRKMRAIEVPSIELAGWTTGPVWFTERPDGNFHDYMSAMMDARVEGALGGNAFAGFVMTVDYGRAQAWFQCVRGCRAAAH